MGCDTLRDGGNFSYHMLNGFVSYFFKEIDGLAKAPAVALRDSPIVFTDYDMRQLMGHSRGNRAA